MALGEIILGGLLLKLLADKKKPAADEKPPPPAAPLPQKTGPAGGDLFDKGAAVLGSAVGLGQQLGTLFGGGGAAAAGTSGAAGLASVFTVEQTATSFVSGAVQGGAEAAKTGGAAVAGGLAAAVASLIVAANAAIALVVLSMLTNLSIAVYFTEKNRQTRKSIGATVLITKDLRELEQRWCLKLLNQVGKELGVPTPWTLGSANVATNYNGTVEYLQEIVSVPSTIPLELQRVLVAYARYLAGVQVRAHHEVVRSYFASVFPTYNPEEYVDGLSDATLNPILAARSSWASTWGVLPAFNQVQAQLDFGNTPLVAVARFLGRYSGAKYVLDAYPNYIPPDVVQECMQRPTLPKCETCKHDAFIARLGLNSLQQLGEVPERWYIDTAAGLALRLMGGLGWQVKSARVATLRAQGHYVPNWLEQIYNDEDAGLVAKLSPAMEIGRQSQADATPYAQRVG